MPKRLHRQPGVAEALLLPWFRQQLLQRQQQHPPLVRALVQLMGIVGEQPVKKAVGRGRRLPHGAQKGGPLRLLPLLYQQTLEDKILPHQVRLHGHQPISAQQPQPFQQLLRTLQTGLRRRRDDVLPFFLREDGFRLLQLRTQPGGGEAVKGEAGPAPAGHLASGQLPQTGLQKAALPVRDVIQHISSVPVGRVLPLHPGSGEEKRVEGAPQVPVDGLEPVQQVFAVLIRGRGMTAESALTQILRKTADDRPELRVLQGGEGQEIRLPAQPLQLIPVIGIGIELLRPLGASGGVSPLQQQHTQRMTALFVHQQRHLLPQRSGVGIDIVHHYQRGVGAGVEKALQIRVVLPRSTVFAGPAIRPGNPLLQLQRQPALAAAAGTCHSPPAEGVLCACDEFGEFVQLRLAALQSGHVGAVFVGLRGRAGQRRVGLLQQLVFLRMQFKQELRKNGTHRGILPVWVDDGPDVHLFHRLYPLLLRSGFTAQNGIVGPPPPSLSADDIHCPVLFQTAPQKQQTAPVHKGLQGRFCVAKKSVMPVVLGSGEHQLPLVGHIPVNRPVELEQAGRGSALRRLLPKALTGGVQDSEIPLQPVLVDHLDALVEVGGQHRTGKQQGQEKNCLLPECGPVLLQLLPPEIENHLVPQLLFAQLVLEELGGAQIFIAFEQPGQSVSIRLSRELLPQRRHRRAPAAVDGGGQAGSHKGENFVYILLDVPVDSLISRRIIHNFLKGHCHTCFLLSASDCAASDGACSFSSIPCFYGNRKSWHSAFRADVLRSGGPDSTGRDCKPPPKQKPDSLPTKLFHCIGRLSGFSVIRVCAC